MAIDRRERSLTRVPRPTQPIAPTRPSPREVALIPREIVVRAPQLAVDLGALAAEQWVTTLSAAQILTELQLERGRAAKAFYGMGLLLRELAKPERYRVELGFESFNALLEQRYMTNRMTALRYIAVVTIFTEIMATELGIEKSYALIKYASSQGKAEDAPGLYAKNVLIGEERVRDMSSRELLRAAKELKAPPTILPPSEAEQQTRRAARAMQAALRRSGAKSAEARAQRRGSTWEVVVRLSPEHAAAWAAGK